MLMSLPFVSYYQLTFKNKQNALTQELVSFSLCIINSLYTEKSKFCASIAKQGLIFTSRFTSIQLFSIKVIHNHAILVKNKATLASLLFQMKGTNLISN